MRLTISVIIYNVEEYLDSCLESIKQQITNDVQILLIDDGSTDYSGIIANHYAEMDERFKVIHKENGGPGSARNTAIDNAIGDYIWFVDGDDIIAENSVHKLLLYLNEEQILPEILICDYFSFDKDEIKLEAMDNIMPNKGECLNGSQCAFLWGNSLFGAVWHCLFQRQFILNTHQRFDEDLYCNEDEDWFISVLTYAKSISIFNEPIYKYRKARAGSILHDSNCFKRFISRYNVYTRWFDYFINLQIQNESTRHMIAYFSESYLGLARDISVLDIQEKRKAIKIYKKRLDISSNELCCSSDYKFMWWSATDII